MGVKILLPDACRPGFKESLTPGAQEKLRGQAECVLQPQEALARQLVRLRSTFPSRGTRIPVAEKCCLTGAGCLLRSRAGPPAHTGGAQSPGLKSGRAWI